MTLLFRFGSRMITSIIMHSRQQLFFEFKLTHSSSFRPETPRSRLMSTSHRLH